MSTDFSIRPVGAPAPTPVVRPSSVAVQQAVQTQLPAAQTVTAAAAVDTSRNDPLAERDRLARQAIFDRDAAVMVYQVIDNRTESVVRQVPEEAIVRRRAYFRELDRASEVSRRIHTDRTA
jgi:uncharacterized FlaG/YvyC family protein